MFEATPAQEEFIEKFLSPETQKLVADAIDEMTGHEGRRQGFVQREMDLKRQATIHSNNLAGWENDLDRGASRDPGFNRMEDDEKKKLAAVQKALARIASKKAEGSSASINLAALADFLHDGVRREWVQKTASYTLKSNETWQSVLDTARAGITALIEDRQAVAKSPLTNEDAKAAMVDEIDSLGKPIGVEQLFLVRKRASAAAIAKLSDIEPPERQGRIQWPMTYVGDSLTESKDAFGVFVWLHRDAIIQRLSDEIDKRPANPNALTKAERIERIAELDRELDRVGRLEELACRMIEADGGSVRRRNDADMRCVLGVEAIGPRNRVRPPREDAVSHYEPNAESTTFHAK